MNPVLLTCYLIMAPLPKAMQPEPAIGIANARVGDWVEFRMTTIGEGTRFESSYRMELTGRTATEALLKFTMTGVGIAFPAQELKFDFRKAADPTQIPRRSAGGDAIIETLGEGKERIKISSGGTNIEYDCDWKTQRVCSKANVGKSELILTTWKSKEAFLDGTIKMATIKYEGNDRKTELVSVLELVNQGRK